MKTEHFFKEDLSEAVGLIKKGEVVAFPTDTVYGLGADALNEKAVQKIFQAKGRPTGRALTVLLAKKEDIHKYAADVPEEALLLVEKFWPGPLTIVLNKKEIFAPSVTADLHTIGLRMPNHSLTLRFIEECGVPLAAPSANSSGRPSPTTAEHVLADLDGKIAAILDGGETPFGIESTVLNLVHPEKPVILRPGGITKNQIEEAIGQEVSTLTSQPPKKEKHYEPEIPLYIVESSWEEALKKMQDENERVAILAQDEVLIRYGHQAEEFYSLGKKGDTDSADKNFFKALRLLEQSSATVILAEMGEEQFSEGYINRLKEAANGKTI